MGIDVSGGVGGITAGLADLDRAGAVLARTGLDVAAASGALLGVATDPAVAAAVLDVARHDPLAGLACGRRLVEIEAAALGVGGSAGLAGESARLEGLALSLFGAVRAYREADATAADALGGLQDAVMGVAVTAVPILLPVAAVDVLAEGPGGALARLDRMAYDEPWLVDTAAGGLDVLVTRLGPSDPAAVVVLGAAAALAGVPWPPRSEVEAARVLGAVSSLAGWLDEDRRWGGVEVEPVASPTPIPAGGVAGVSGLLATAADLGSEAAPGRVRVTQVPQEDGTSAWILQLPGTQVWDPDAGENPFDLTTNLEAMTEQATLAAAGAARALDRAMAAVGRSGSRDRVMLVGHSQGGILAAALASDARFRAGHRVTDVVTFGSPVGRFPIPETVTVLSVEHVQDPVPRLDAVPNPDRRTWTTVTRDLGSSSSGSRSAMAAHGTSTYLETAREIDAATGSGGSASLTVWARHAGPFLDGSRRRVSTDYHLRRTPRPPP